MKIAESSVHYLTSEDQIIEQALRILGSRMRHGVEMNSPDKVKNYAKLHFAQHQRECFLVLFIDAKNRLIKADEMFQGTLCATSVYPREVVKAALLLNAAAVIISHNHPSGDPAPSQPDQLITRALQQALELVDIKLLDHIIVAGIASYSFAENGAI